MTEAWNRGRVVAGKYRLVEKLGEGGMGAIWRADHETLRSQVALKLVNESALASEEGLQRFLREARAAAQIRSPHVVQILDHGVEDGVPYIAMELLEGESLSSRLARVGTLSLAQTARLVTHVGRAMTKAHEAGIVHRDLKPDNIFLVRNDDEELAKVLDFGIAKVTHGLAEEVGKLTTRTGALLGTPYYMSPEQVRGHALDHRTDLWSLGVIAYECVTGRLPFEAETVGDLLLQICTSPIPVPSALAKVPAAFDAWFTRAVARAADQRFQSAREMVDALRTAAGDAPTEGDAGRFAVGPGSAGPRAAREEAETVAAPVSSLRDEAEARALGVERTLAAGVEPSLPAVGRTSVGRGSARESLPPAARPRPWALVAVGILAAGGVVAWLVRGGGAGAESAPASGLAAASAAQLAPSVPAPLAPPGEAAIKVEPAPVEPAGSASPSPAPSAAPPAAPKVPRTPAVRPSAAPRAEPSATAAPPKKKDELAF